MENTRYVPTIGLEIHAELRTATKMFCNSRNDPDAIQPNIHICPVCMAHPGTLPVINKQAVAHVLRVGMALRGTLAEYAEFDRKNYFYPDLPKGYQISQYQYPLVSGGTLEGVAITRVHLEEDTARSQHGSDGFSIVDYNRAGVPLMELVTEPVVRTAEEAVRFARALQLLLRYLKAGDANMEKGEMRVEANISIAPPGEPFGTKVEVKNLNSFRAVERAIAYEIARQEELLRRGEKVVQETRGWNENTQTTFAQRLKEESHDYRYFPDPDLPKFIRSKIAEFSDDALLSAMPELPDERRSRYERLGLKAEDVLTLMQNVRLGELFDGVLVQIQGDKKKITLAANYITTDLQGLMGSASTPGGAQAEHIDAAHFAALIGMIADGTLSSRGAKDVLVAMHAEGGDPERIARERGLLQESDPEALQKIVETVIAAHRSVADDYIAGKASALQFLVGQAMRESKGAANPQVVAALFQKALQ